MLTILVHVPSNSFFLFLFWNLCISQSTLQFAQGHLVVCAYHSDKCLLCCWKLFRLAQEPMVWALAKYPSKVGFNHLSIQNRVLYVAFQSRFSARKKKGKEKYQSYGPNGKVICSDQLPFIPVWWKMAYKLWFLQEDRVPVVTFWHAGKNGMQLWFP